LFGCEKKALVFGDFDDSLAELCTPFNDDVDLKSFTHENRN
jgi:hypothetical protein